MTAFIIEYWWQIAVYLIGCVLAYGRVYAFMCAYTKESQQQLLPWDIISAVIWVVLSWIGFVMIAGLWQKGDKFFKWLPVLLLWCIMGVGCENSRSGDVIVEIESNKSFGSPTECKYYTNLTGVWNFPVTADCSLYKIGDTLWLGKKTPYQGED